MRNPLGLGGFKEGQAIASILKASFRLVFQLEPSPPWASSCLHERCSGKNSQTPNHMIVNYQECFSIPIPTRSVFFSWDSHGKPHLGPACCTCPQPHPWRSQRWSSLQPGTKVGATMVRSTTLLSQQGCVPHLPTLASSSLAMSNHNYISGNVRTISSLHCWLLRRAIFTNQQ